MHTSLIEEYKNSFSIRKSRRLYLQNLETLNFTFPFSTLQSILSAQFYVFKDKNQTAFILKNPYHKQYWIYLNYHWINNTITNNRWIHHHFIPKPPSTQKTLNPHKFNLKKKNIFHNVTNGTTSDITHTPYFGTTANPYLLRCIFLFSEERAERPSTGPQSYGAHISGAPPPWPPRMRETMGMNNPANIQKR